MVPQSSRPPGSLATPKETEEETLAEQVVTAREDLRDALQRLRLRRLEVQKLADWAELLSEFEADYERCFVRLRNAREARRVRARKR